MYVHILCICRAPHTALGPPHGPRAARAQGRSPSNAQGGAPPEL